jgi:Sap, sulfolipid-1-addressing protein
MLGEAAGLAALAGLSPTALLVVAVFLGAENPRRIVLIYLVGGIVMTVLIAVVVYVVLQGGHVYKPRQHATRYGLRLGLGLLMLIVVPFLRRHWNQAGEARDTGKKGGGGLLGRMIATPRPVAAFLVGVIVYSPPVAFIAAVQVVATAKESTADAVGAIILLIAITLTFIWLPFVLHLVAPDQTRRFLEALNGWLGRHGRTLVLSALVVGGVYLTVNGILGLTGVVS